MTRVLALTGFTVLFLAACAGPSVDSGNVAAKNHESAWMMPMTTIMGKVPVTTYIPVPEKWTIKVCTPDEINQECEWWSVNSEAYDSLSIGDPVTKEGK